jgi:phosphatidate cytidylyltransferase
MCYIFYQQKKDVKTTAHACLSVLYIFASFFSFYKLAQFENGHFLILWMYIVVWSTDSGAYAIGRYLKGPKLWRRISPNKTWSGFIGGVYTALIISGTATEIPLFSFLKNIDLSHYWLIAFLSCAGHIGDLLESAYKRYYGVKDSGSIIPGHGGILDRLDSLLLVSIFSYFLVYLGYLKI